jgi:hypothetical protein
MDARAARTMYAVDWILPIVIAGLFVLLSSLLREPTRRRFNAIFVAGAGSAYLNGGFGVLEFPFTALGTYLAFRGLDDYRFIGVAALPHDLGRRAPLLGDSDRAVPGNVVGRMRDHRRFDRSLVLPWRPERVRPSAATLRRAREGDARAGRRRPFALAGMRRGRFPAPI